MKRKFLAHVSRHWPEILTVMAVILLWLGYMSRFW
jgi:hypothetical protein